MTLDVVRSALDDAASALAALRANALAQQAIVAAGELLARTFAARRKVLSCGNGGSMCDAMHFAEELSGRFRTDRAGYPALAISDPSHLTCVGNDYGYEQVFARYVQAHGNPGDVLLAISTSGASRNVVVAAQSAQVAGMKVIALIGNAGAPLEAHADIVVCTPGGRFADRVQELHIKVIHIMIELVERQLAPNNYQG